MTDPARIAPDRVTVRMYKGILGDCLMLILEKDAHDPTHILIDCGVLQGTPGADVLMKERVANIFATTGSKGLDLVVITHEHADHISGFALAAETFKANKLDKLWLAWTEDPHDPDGIEFQQRFGEGFAILGALGATLRIDGSDDSIRHNDPLGLTGFSGNLPTQDPKTKKIGPRSSRAIYKNLSDQVGAGNTAFLSPGMVLDTPGALALRTYVLGPPRDARMMAKTVPNGSEKDAQEYFAMAGRDSGAAELRSPFAKPYRWKSRKQISRVRMPSSHFDRLNAEALTALRYFGTSRPDLDFDPGESQVHRAIDDTAQTMFSTLSIRMDNMTNNSSLVLAFELPGDAGILLFAADAQAGNWLSWKNVAFREKPDAKPLKLTSADLLARTRFYKVGHHGSHNATMKQDGLERMTSGELVSMVPTDAEVARKQPAHWQMPNPKVEAALLDKGLVLRGDRTIDDAIKARTGRPDGPVLSELTSWTRQRVREHDLYVEYVVFDRDRDG